jgi:hypothetical protein
VPHFSLYYFFDFHAVNVHEFTGWYVAASDRGKLALSSLQVDGQRPHPHLHRLYGLALRIRTFTRIGRCQPASPSISPHSLDTVWP